MHQNVLLLFVTADRFNGALVVIGDWLSDLPVVEDVLGRESKRPADILTQYIQFLAYCAPDECVATGKIHEEVAGCRPVFLSLNRRLQSTRTPLTHAKFCRAHLEVLTLVLSILWQFAA